MTLDAATINAKAKELGLPVDYFDPPAYPDFLPDKGYLLRVIDARNTVSKLGSSQVELSVVAVDEDGNLNGHARAKLWLTYPWDTAQWRFKDREQRERAHRDMLTLLRTTGDTRYLEYAQKTHDGRRSHYYDAEGNELSGSSFDDARKLARIATLEELRAREQNPAAWIGTTFYAQRRVNEYEGKTYKGWQRISAEPLSGIEYILDVNKMLSRPSEEVKDDDDDQVPF